MDWVIGAISLGAPMLQGHSVHTQQLKQGQMHHDQQIRLEIELARRDILQEMRDQKADKLETLMVMDTLMLGCSFAILVEGMPPRHAWRPMIALFALCLALSISLFFLSVWFVMKVQSRMTRYNILNPDHLYDCGLMHPSFQAFYRCHCHVLSRVATSLYYGGVLMLVICSTVLVYTRFLLKFRAPESGVLFAAVTSLFVCSLLVLERKIGVGPRLTDKDFEGHSTLRNALGRQRPTEPAMAENGVV